MDNAEQNAPSEDAGAQRFTSSTDGFLVGPHPELGDVVYDEDGATIGTLSFFYDRLNDAHYRVQIEGHAEDPIVVQVESVLVTGGAPRHRLIAKPGVAAQLPVTGGASVVIS